MAPNTLYYGDNLDILRRYVQDESVDLVYLDPPFNSNQTYNILFREKDGSQSASQIKAFEDTWQWDEAAARSFEETVESGGQVSDALIAFRQILGTNDMLAYLSMMAPRLVELRRVLKPTGSLYLHCDPTASHCLKLLLDSIFGPTRFRTEIIWKRTSAHSDTRQGRRQHGRIHDVLLFYTKTDDWRWHPVYTEYDPRYVDDFYRFVEPETNRRYRKGDLTAARPGGNTSYEWRVKRPLDKEWQADLTDEWKSPRPGWEYKGIPPTVVVTGRTQERIWKGSFVKGGSSTQGPACRTTSVTWTRCREFHCKTYGRTYARHKALNVSVIPRRNP